MQLHYQNTHESRNFVAAIVSDRFSLGRSSSCDVVMSSPMVSPEAAVLTRIDDRWQLTVLNDNGIQMHGRDLEAGTTITLDRRDTFAIFPYEFTLDPEDTAQPTQDQVWSELESRAIELVRQIHIQLLESMDPRSEKTDQLHDDALLRIERNIEVLARQHGILEDCNRDLVLYLAGQCIRGELVDTTLKHTDKQIGLPLDTHHGWSRIRSTHGLQESELKRLQKLVTAELRLSPPKQVTERMREIESGFRSAWRRVVPTVLEETLVYLSLRQLKKQIKDIVFGYGPLEDLLRLPTVSEIMVVGSDRIFVERNGVIENSGRRFISDKVTASVIERIVARVGRQIDTSRPIADARLSDGSRVNAVKAPIALDGPLLTVRKFPHQRITIDELISEYASLSEAAARFLRACVLAKKNILISGGTGTGKTTMLNCLADYIPDKERIVTIEDTAELQLNKQHVARMETRPANSEGRGQYDIADLVRNALRMRPDRVVVGECRGKEALWMLQAMNTGHDGSMTTIHANSAADVILRLEVMVQAASDLPINSIHRQVGSAIDMVVQLERQRGGGRVVSDVAEIEPTTLTDSTLRLRSVFRRTSDDELRPTGQLPTFMPELLSNELLNLETLYF